MSEQCRNSVGTPQTPMNTRISYTVPDVPLLLYKEYIENIEL